MGDAGFGLGLLLGFAAGIGIGISIGRKQKPWSELDEREKKVRIGVIAAGFVLLLAAVIFGLIRLYS